MRGTIRLPAHQPTVPRDPHPTSADDPDRFYGRECYVFNATLRSNLNDTHCSHCRFYLTARCPHIDEFLDDVEELGPE